MQNWSPTALLQTLQTAFAPRVKFILFRGLVGLAGSGPLSQHSLSPSPPAAPCFSPHWTLVLQTPHILTFPCYFFTLFPMSHSLLFVLQPQQLVTSHLCLRTGVSTYLLKCTLAVQALVAQPTCVLTRHLRFLMWAFTPLRCNCHFPLWLLLWNLCGQGPLLSWLPYSQPARMTFDEYKNRRKCSMNLLCLFDFWLYW